MVRRTPFFGAGVEAILAILSRNSQIVMSWVVTFHRHEQRRTFDLHFSASSACPVARWPMPGQGEDSENS